MTGHAGPILGIFVVLHGSELVFLAVFSWLTAATPVWLSLLVIGALAAVAWQLWVTIRRIDRHAQSIAHMDEWADSVDESITRLQDRARRPPPPPPAPPSAAPRSAADFKKLWQK